jgi:general secretion pathway protein G
MRNRRLNKAFTLVEILIVVVILGILAAIVVPQFTNATQDAQTGNLRSQIKSIQNQLELYKARTNNYPNIIANGWVDMINGGYLKAAPKNPFNNQTTVVAGAFAADGSVAGAAGNGWVYDATTGQFSACYYDEVNQTLDTANP